MLQASNCRPVTVMSVLQQLQLGYDMQNTRQYFRRISCSHRCVTMPQVLTCQNNC